GSGLTAPPLTAAARPALESEELTILTAWAEGVSEASAFAPQRVEALLAEARAGAAWRAELGLPEPSPRLSEALDSLAGLAGAAVAPDGGARFDALLTQAGEDRPGERTVERLARRVLLSMLEERATRQAT